MNTVNKMKPSERMKIPRQTSIEQKPDERNKNFTEVSFGVDEERALIEAARCLECQNPVCREGCPVNIDIRSFVQLVYQKDYASIHSQRQNVPIFQSQRDRIFSPVCRRIRTALPAGIRGRK